MAKGNYDEIAGSFENRKTFIFFTGLTILTQIVGLIMIILIGVWMGNYRGGFSWTTPSLEFNYHPFFMTLGLIFFYGDSILLYRVFRNTTKIYVKIAHALMHIFALIFSSVALKAVFDSHNYATPDPIPNLYSLHSWFGLTVVILFIMQWICGFVSFLFPKLSETVRKAYLPAHKTWGIIIFIMSCATALMGITEKAIFSLSKDYSKLPYEAKLLNMFGVLIGVFCGLVVYLVTQYDYRRPSDDELHKPLTE